MTQAALANPFGEDFAAIYRVIAGAAGQRGTEQAKTIAKLVAQVAEEILPTIREIHLPPDM